MRNKDLHSLVWLCRWYGGRAQRLDNIHRTHLANIQQLVLDELGGFPQEPQELQLYGFALVVTADSQGLAVLSITPPSFMNGEQLDLFGCDPEETEESNFPEEVQHGAATR